MNGWVLLAGLALGTLFCFIHELLVRIMGKRPETPRKPRYTVYDEREPRA